jgi:guanylate kinase
MDALEKANMIRADRKALKQGLKDRTVSILDIIEDPPEYALTMKLTDLLLAVPGLGAGKVMRAVDRLRISQCKTLGGLTYDQRDRVTTYLIWRD